MSEDKVLDNIVQGCVRNQRKEQQQLYKLFYGKMLAVCLRYTKNMDQAKDILQDGFIKVYSNIDRYSGSGSFEGWIRRIIVNTAIDHFRKSKKDFILLGSDEMLANIAEQERDEEETGYYDYSPEDIIDAMHQLSNAYRVVFNLYVYENLQHKEIAKKLGISEGTSKSNYSKAKKNLKKILLNQKK